KIFLLREMTEIKKENDQNLVTDNTTKMISGINQLIVDSTSSLKRSYVDAEPTNVYTSLNGGQSSGNVGTDIKDEVYLHNKKQREAEKIQPTNDKPAPFVNNFKILKFIQKDIAKVRDSRTIQITATNKI
ncbi:hypothetical protein RFI_33280, partial [Reticulomyxa filosa]